MKTHIYLIILVAIFLWNTPNNLFAADPEICDAKLFSCYQEKIKSCTDKQAPWATGPDLGAVSLPYKEFQSGNYTSLLTSIPDAQKNPDEKAKLQTLLAAYTEREMDGFRAAGIVGVQYRGNMNNIFSCAIVATRADKLKRLKEAIKEDEGSDIQKKLTKELSRYEKLKGEQNCLQNKSESKDDKIVDRLTVSAATEYCKYTLYLDYLEANINSDNAEALKIDAQISGNTGSVGPKTTDEALAKFTSRTNALRLERTRAKDTVPKAVLAYQEMDRTYVIHLLLVIIYDDYLKLRDGLNTYLSIVSQTFEKAYNAQDANRR